MSITLYSTGASSSGAGVQIGMSSMGGGVIAGVQPVIRRWQSRRMVVIRPSFCTEWTGKLFS